MGSSNGVPPTYDPNDPYTGQNTREYMELLRQRAEIDEYRNPRIHIFRRAWWQDEHIPTEEGAAYASTEAETKLRPTFTPIVDGHAEAKARTEAEKETLYDQWRDLRRVIFNWRTNADPTTYVTTDDDPLQWSLTSGVGFTGLPAQVQQWINDWVGLCAILAWGGMRGDPRNPLDTFVRATRALYQRMQPTRATMRQWTVQP